MSIMKKILALLSMVLVVAACSKDTDTQVEMASGEGAVRLGVATKAAVSTDESVVIKIYKVEGEDETLIRRYDSLSDVPEYLSLLTGNYTAKVQVGERCVATFDSKYYYGEADFAVEAGIVTPVTVDCTLGSTVVAVEYDATVAANLSEGYFTSVSVADAYDATAIAKGDISALEYEESKEGYFMLPEGQTSLYWHFEGTHPVEGDIVKEGLIENVKTAVRYTVKLKYSPDAPGGLTIEATVDESIEEFDDVIIFSPDPTIMGEGFDLSEQQLSTIDSRTYNVASLAAIETMTLTVSGVEHDLLSNAPEGITIQKNDDLSYKVIVSEAFFSQVAGGEQALSFHIMDVDGGKLTKDVNYLVQGVMPVATSDYDLWFGNVTFKATVIDSASSVKIAYSADGATWTEVDAVAAADGTYTAAGSNFAAEKNYTYKLVVEGADAGKALTHQTAAGAQIPNGDMERWSKPTWWLPYGDGDVAFWLTGNEGGNMAGATLTQPSTDVRPGSTGTQSAYLKSQKASVMGIGKFAAGNLFTGTFAMNGLDGIVTFGRDFNFTARPASLSFWMKNNEGTINEGSQASGTDMYTIMVLITDGTTYAVNTKDTSTFLTMDSLATRDGIIAYGYLQGTDSRAEWTQETINITYREDMKSVKPKKIVVSFTPSGYGDYFCGSTSSWMYVDDIVLNY